MTWQRHAELVGLAFVAVVIWLCLIDLAGAAADHQALISTCNGEYAQVIQGKLAPEVVFDPASSCQLEGWRP